MRFYILHLWNFFNTEILANIDTGPWAYYFNWAYATLGKHLKYSIRFLSWYLPFSISLYCRIITPKWRLRGRFSTVQLNRFWNMEISLKLNKFKKKQYWSYSLNSTENISAPNLYSNGKYASLTCNSRSV